MATVSRADKSYPINLRGVISPQQWRTPVIEWFLILCAYFAFIYQSLFF